MEKHAFYNLLGFKGEDVNIQDLEYMNIFINIHGKQIILKIESDINMSVKGSCNYIIDNTFFGLGIIQKRQKVSLLQNTLNY